MMKRDSMFLVRQAQVGLPFLMLKDDRVISIVFHDDDYVQQLTSVMCRIYRNLKVDQLLFDVLATNNSLDY